MSADKTPTFHEALWDLIKEIRFPMFVHRHPGGMMHAHPLTLQNKHLEPGEPLYFFVQKSSELGQRLMVDGTVCVAFSDLKADCYVSVSGQATINEDMAKKKELFNAMTKAWFPGGVEDPNLELVEVAIEHAEYWNVKESQMTQLLKIATAAVTGKPPQMGEHDEMHIGSKEPAPQA